MICKIVDSVKQYVVVSMLFGFLLFAVFIMTQSRLKAFWIATFKYLVVSVNDMVAWLLRQFDDCWVGE